MIRTTVSVLTCLIVLGCSQQKPKASAIESVQFAVDTALIAPFIVDTSLGISFSPPRGWIAFSATSLDAARREGKEHAARNGESGQPEILYAWSHASTGGVAVVAAFAGFDVSDSSSTMREFERLFRSSKPGADIRSALFSFKTIKVHQLMVADDQRVDFKMVFSGPRLKKPMQLDFAIPRGAYPQMIRTIESVAGSIDSYQSTPPIN